MIISNFESIRDGNLIIRYIIRKNNRTEVNIRPNEKYTNKYKNMKPSVENRPTLSFLKRCLDMSINKIIMRKSINNMILFVIK
jgi:hypothetical protein